MTNLTVVYAAKKGLERAQKCISKRKGIKFLKMKKNEKTLLSIMFERFKNYGKVEDEKTLFGCGFVLTTEEAAAFGLKSNKDTVYTLDTYPNSQRISIIPMCEPSEFIDNKN